MAARADLQDMPFPEADLTIVCWWFKQINLERIATTSTLFRTSSRTDFPDCAYTHAKDPVSLGNQKADKATNQVALQQPSDTYTIEELDLTILKDML